MPSSRALSGSPGISVPPHPAALSAHATPPAEGNLTACNWKSILTSRCRNVCLCEKASWIPCSTSECPSQPFSQPRDYFVRRGREVSPFFFFFPNDDHATLPLHSPCGGDEKSSFLRAGIILSIYLRPRFSLTKTRRAREKRERLGVGVDWACKRSEINEERGSSVFHKEIIFSKSLLDGPDDTWEFFAA